MDYRLIKSPLPQKELTAVERVLTNRGIKLEEIPHYLQTTDNDIIDPMTIANIKEGAQLIIKHIAANHHILIQVDSDCDGYTSAAALINYLNCLFPAFTQNNIHYRFHEGKEHGIIPGTIPDNISLVIAPDSSSNDYEQHKALADRNIDILVIDHHEAEKVSEYACIINNQLCDYPTKSLSGVGMVYKFCQYIDEIMDMNFADYLLDLVALGMIADMMDLRDFETKHLINKGIQDIRNPFFNKMIERNSYSLGDNITPMGVAFYVAPYVNATIRMGTSTEKRIMFESMLEFKAYTEVSSTKRGCKGQMEQLVTQAVRNCTNIKNRQTKTRDTSVENIERQIEKYPKILNNKILVLYLEAGKVDRNLTGLIANQLMSKYRRPVILLHKIQQKDGSFTWEGSARGYDKSELNDFKALVNNSSYAMYAEGHANAFGCGFNSEENIAKLTAYANLQLKECNFDPIYDVDFIFQADNFNGSDIIEIAELKSLWGQGIDEPYIALENIKIKNDNITLMSAEKNPTLKIILPNGTSLIKFKSSIEEFESLKTEGVIYLNIVGRCERNIWNGRISPQIIIEDYEITNSINYYF